MQDGEEQTLEGIVETVTFHNNENGFTVLQLNVGGELVTAVGTFFEIGAGEEIVLHGRWSSHALFGRQFRTESYETRLPDNAAALLRYLSAGMIRGVGPKTARRIVERFGENSFDVLENDWERLAAIKGISREKAAAISNEFKKQFSIRTVMSELDRYGIRAAECIRIFKRFGGSAVEVIKRNPYILCAEISGFDFARTDEIAARLPEPPAPSYRLEAGILYVLRYNQRNGHTAVPEEKIFSPCRALLGEGDEAIREELERLILLREVIRVRIGERDFLFLPKMYAAEANAAARLKELLRFPPLAMASAGENPAQIEAQTGVHYEEKQLEAIRVSAEKGVMILTGGPGTGKTTTVRGMIAFFEKHGLRILLAAPTGRAAKRMSELTGKNACTLHRLLEVVWTDEDEATFTRDRQNPLEADAVIVDELSMVDVTVFSALLDAIPFGCRLILVGDTDQLPPVGAGNVLLDMVRSGKIPVVRLTEIFRQAQESLIVTNAHRIVAGKTPETTRRDGDFFFIEQNSSLAAASLVVQLAAVRLPNAYGFDPVADIQVLCPSRKGDCGTVNLNIRLQQALNPPSDDKEEVRSFGRILRQGDKIMQIKNNYEIPWEKDGESGSGIFNGDMGVIRKISRAENEMTIDFDGRLTVYPLDSMSELELAYAVTVHKSQGSEYPAVIVPVVDAPPQLMYRNLLYTAVTRARQLLVLTGRRDRLAEMVENNRKNRRYSALAHFLTDESPRENPAEPQSKP